MRHVENFLVRSLIPRSVESTRAGFFLRRNIWRLSSLCVGFVGLASLAFGQTADTDAELLPSAVAPIHHTLIVKLDPRNNRLEVLDQIDLPESFGRSDISFALNANLTITNRPRGLRQLGFTEAELAQGINETGGLTATTARYSIDLPRRRSQPLELAYSGTLFDATKQTGAQYSQSFSETSGIIDSRGVYLNKGSVWIPEFGDELVTFDLRVEFVESSRHWQSISQGDRLASNQWRSEAPMEEVYLIAAEFTEYQSSYTSVLPIGESTHAEIDVLALLRTPDANLAAKYLDATERYLALYEPLLGAYPFSKFALVENFWETGYGMPSFTLLGEQIIRFPFIINSSYPHEILHNWWGNGVYPDYQSGNWSEGLTAYLADHLFQEIDGRGAEYRKEMLARYKNYVSDGTDFPLSEFTSRNSAASQAVGYGKTLMLWHMLRVELGDELFLSGLREFFDDYKFSRASFDDIAAHFSRIAQRDLEPFFAQWVTRRGAPELALSVGEENGDKARLNFAQIQESAPFVVKVPVALYYADQEAPQLVELELSQRSQGFLADDYSRLEAVAVDPFFDVFRTLDRTEIPPTIGELFGAEALTFVLPSSGETLNKIEWRAIADAFGQGIDTKVVLDSEIDVLPATQSVWVLGRSNRFAETALTAAGANVALGTEGRGYVLAGSAVSLADRSSVFVARHPTAADLAIGFLDIDQPIAVSGMIEKLPHYGKYSYLSFEGEEPTNDVKGVWEASGSPLIWTNPELSHVTSLANVSATEPLIALPALAELPPKYLAANLQRHVRALTQATMKGRASVRMPSESVAGIDLAADYIESEFRRIGLNAVGGSYRQSWTETLKEGSVQRMTNVIGLIPGSDPAFVEEPVILGAHYDHLGITADGGVYLGADDNASGIAALIEVAAKLKRAFTFARPILVIAFTGEEEGLLGSDHFVRSPLSGVGQLNPLAMINLDAVGRLEGRSLQVFGSESAYEWPFMAQGIGFTIGVDSELPAQAIASSDHVSFLNAGIPALHLFSGLHTDYHRVGDTADKLDYDGLSRVASWTEEALVYLADLRGPLRVTLANASLAVAPEGSGARRASLGTLPDFAYTGRGVRISGVTPNSAAAAAGLREGDILLSFAGSVVNDLQIYSNLLRASAIGDAVIIELLRGDETLSLDVTLTARE